ncbi:MULTISPECIES: YqhG family protein [Clostridia]|uniref:YqhG family protein n=1 Tax=Clostridia TaxID=186801 RepID=UPI000EA05CB0|nr:MULTISPECIES: YqhG family protein [Clostridia]NBJ70173.1 hypothetical protein [Roseburia sp. 1XD42-34]RKI76914.1 hypothetical protein D7V87_11895 [Clostridium sp. 1xD42-85]
MEIHDLNAFLYDFFKAHHCPILTNHDGVLTIQLTEEMDKVLMNRPFYWHYIKKMGYPGDPMQLTLITNPDKRQEKGEWIHFGSPRLQQIIRYLQQSEKYTKLFQQLNPNVNTPLFPWLVTNIKISYQGKHKRDELFSIGLNLINGVLKSDMMDLLKAISLETTISDYCYTLSPMIKLHSGYKRIESVLDQYVESQEHSWAIEALQALEEETTLLHHFYTEDTEDETMERELKEIQERFQPKITYQVVNGGLFYLASDTA